jgi:acylphosphatase
MDGKLVYKVRLTGRVQGVGFRWNTANEARIRGISGLVRNLADGSVYIEAEGTREQLDSFIEWCKQGPGLSRIDKLDVTTSPPLNYNDFRIEHD